MCQYDPSDEDQVEAAARAWLEWQFKGQDWDTASSDLKKKFREGARSILEAAAAVSREKKEPT